jgi:putative ATP-dependent endonuclease of OLD family
VRITRIEIENWRSIKEVDFRPEQICVLVGANNAGKTNILSAINFLLGDRWPMPANLEDGDYFQRDRARRIRIKLSLDHPIYSSVEFDTSKATYVFNANGRDGYAVRGFNNAMREEIAFAYVDAGRSYERQFGQSRWTLFGQVLRHLHQRLRENRDQLQQLRDALAVAHQMLQTDIYRTFETALKDAFAAQLRTARYDVSFEFKTIEETNLYRGLFPTLIERGTARNPLEVGSGVRNVLVLALFQAFAKTFRGDAVLGIEEPELYLHPHAQRSLMRQFEQMAVEGNQIFISSHSGHFLDVSRSDRIVLVEQCEDDEEEICTQVRTASANQLVAKRQALHPARQMSVTSMQEFIRNIRTAEMTEAFFGRVVVIVEGASEREAIPIYARSLGLDFDEHGISIVAAGGKTAIDTLAQLYQAHEIRTYVVFDNDTDNGREAVPNRTLCRMLGLPEEDTPTARVTDNFAILGGNWEKQSEQDLELISPGAYRAAEREARAALGLAADRNKPIVARYVANKMARAAMVPQSVSEIVGPIKAKLPA